jgi:phosphatidylglycerophosphate synthase
MSLPPSIYGKLTTLFEILLIFLVLVLQIRESPVLLMAKHACAYLVAALVCISGLHYSIVVSRRLHTGV